MNRSGRCLTRLRRWWDSTRPVTDETAAAMRERAHALPEHVRAPAQTLGQHAVGCEGTHGVFPRCNLACTPCYHSRDANRVRVEGGHTLAQVRAQMRLLRERRGPRAHAQLIGGEVSLLPPDDHAAALLAMREQGREPMSMSYGDFDADYLTALALDAHGQPRLPRLSFAGHFDMLMFGRRGIERPPDERSLHPHRRQFVDMFVALRREHGVPYFLAHNMTVTPRNLVQIADVWAQIEAGAGTRLPFRALQVGDERCNRTTHGFYVGDRYFPILDEEKPADLHTRDVFFRHLGGVDFAGTALPTLAVKLARVIVRHPSVAVVFIAWILRMGHAVGLWRLLRHRRIRPVTFVMHSFIDAAEVAPAWEALQRGETSSQPRVLAAQQRLQACSYVMAHPESGELVPACVQHSVLDPVENVALRQTLPMLPTVRARREGRCA